MKNGILQKIAEVANKILKEQTLPADFKRLADLIKDLKNPSMKQEFAKRVIETEKNNPRFNKDLFLQACGLESPSAAQARKQAAAKIIDDIMRNAG